MKSAVARDFEALIREMKRFKADFEQQFTANPRYVMTKGGHTYAASPNIGECPWRLTSFWDGEPTGHMEFSSLDSLAQEVWSLSRQGYETRAPAVPAQSPSTEEPNASTNTRAVASDQSGR